MSISSSGRQPSSAGDCAMAARQIRPAAWAAAAGSAARWKSVRLNPLSLYPHVGMLEPVMRARRGPHEVRDDIGRGGRHGRGSNVMILGPAVEDKRGRDHVHRLSWRLGRARSEETDEP